MKTKSTSKKPLKKSSVAKGKKGALRGADIRQSVIEQSTSVIPFVLKTLFVIGVGYWGIRMYKNRFKERPEISDYEDANITVPEAESRADAIFGAIGIFLGDFDTIVNAFSHPQGLNYNAYIRIYNAFGKRKSTYLQKEMNLTEWFSDKLSDYQKQQIATLTSGVIVP